MPCDIVGHIHNSKTETIWQFDPYGWIAEVNLFFFIHGSDFAVFTIEASINTAKLSLLLIYRDIG